MEHLILFFFYIAWLLFSLLEGARDAASFSHGNTSHPFNIHKFYLPVRGLFFVCILMTVNILGGFSFFGLALDFLGHMLTFSFFHNGAYYETRRRLEPDNEKLSDYNWKHQSTTTTAKLSFNFQYRSLMLIAGIVLYIIHLIIL